MSGVIAALVTKMFEVNLNNQVSTYAHPQDAVVFLMQTLGIEQIHWPPIYQAVSSLGSGKSFYDNDSGAVITNLY